MARSPRRLRIGAAAAAATVVAVTGGTAAADTTNTQPVTVTALAGTRTLNVLSLTGGPLNGLVLGTGHAGAFLTNVTDVGYQNVGYQVTAELSNLYPYDAKSGSYNFQGTSIPSNAVSLGFPTTNPLDLTNVASDVTPVIQLTGDLSGFTASLLTQLGGLLTLPSSITTTLSTTVDGATTPVSNAVKEILDGLANDLPIQLQTGSGGSFTNPGPLTGVSGAPAPQGTPTDLLIEKGTPNSVSGLLSDLLTQLGAGADGTIPISTLISQGIVSKDDVLSAIQSATGIPLDFLTSNATAILNTVTAKITNLAAILGQDGSYNALPLLSVNLPKNTPAGTYQGILTVTLMDTPSN